MNNKKYGKLQQKNLVILQANSLHKVLFGLSVFLNLFQLVFSVSERAMYALLGILCILITHLSALSPTNPLLWQLSISLPKSLASIQKCIKHDSITSDCCLPSVLQTL